MNYEHQDFPSDTWTRIGQNGTVDGNQMLVMPRIHNPLDSLIPVKLRYIVTDTGERLPNCYEDSWLANETTWDYPCLWDTDGWAWDDHFSTTPVAHPEYTVRVEMEIFGEVVDTFEKRIVIRPKPVILVHGLNSNAAGWSSYPGFLRSANDYWEGYAVPTLRTGNDVLFQQQSDSIMTNAQRIHSYIENVRETENAWHVDIVAHSLGGLMSRRYIHSFMPTNTPTGRPVAKHLVMLGTPNRGSLCAKESLFMNLMLRQPNLVAPLELSPEVVDKYFNPVVTDQKGVKFSVLAGNTSVFVCNPTETTPNDMVVTVPSAHYIYTDVGLTSSNHIEMTGSQADFVRWVLPHLATPRGADRADQGSAQPAATLPAAQAAGDLLPTIQVISQTVAAGAIVDVPLSVPAAGELRLVYAAPAQTVLTLRNPAGTSAATGNGGVAAWYQTLVVADPPAGGWTLRIRNNAATDAPVRAALQVADSAVTATANAGAPDADGNVLVTLHLTDAGQPVTGAVVSGTYLRPTGTTVVRPFADGVPANDGQYTTQVVANAEGMYALLIEATFGGQTWYVPLTFTVGGGDGVPTAVTLARGANVGPAQAVGLLLLLLLALVTLLVRRSAFTVR